MRTPTPTKLLSLTKGKLYGDQRDRAELEPKPKRELVPRCPSAFTPAERREFRFYKRILENYGLFTLAAAPALEKLCMAEVRYREAARAIAESGTIIRAPTGIPMRNPYFGIMKSEEKSILAWQREIGLTNTGLARMGSLALAAKKERETGLADLLD